MASVLDWHISEALGYPFEERILLHEDGLREVQLRIYARTKISDTNIMSPDAQAYVKMKFVQALKDQLQTTINAMLKEGTHS